MDRRTFVKGLTAGGVLAGLGLWRTPAWASEGARQLAAPLTGDTFELRIGELPVNFTGAPQTAFVVNDSLPAPTLRWREGDRVRLRVHNDLSDHDASIHWHGILLPANMDGVPGLSFHGIRPGESYLYEFDVKQSGTYWYHSHSGFQEQRGVYGALIIDPREASTREYDREHVVLLSDWTDMDPRTVLAKLKKQAHYFNYNQRTVGDFFRDVREHGWAQTIADRKMWGAMRMNPTDLADVTGAAYTYLMNGITPSGNWTGLFAPGERVLLRFINGSAQSYFDVRIPGLKLTIVAADGLPVRPVTVDEFRIAAAETFDVLVEPGAADAVTIFAQSIDRSGFAAGTLAVRAGLRAPVPVLDPPQVLTMADMGHGEMPHGAMQHDDTAHESTSQDSTGLDAMHHGARGGAAVTSAGTGAAAVGAVPGSGRSAAQGSGRTPPPGEAHAGHTMPSASPSAADPHAGHAMPNDTPPAADPHAGHAMPSAPPSAADPHAGHAMPSPQAVVDHAGHGSSAGGTMQTHPATEEGNPLVDMQATTPAARLDDPGVGLRGNGRHVLTYSQLRSAFDDPDGREPSRTIELHLTGHMEKFAWHFNGVKFSDAAPIVLKYGERVRITLVNDTMMSHPIHLHGMWSDLEDEDGRFLVRKHTIDMPPGTRRSYRVRADALGRWAYHCHLLYHMESGMFREVRVEE